MKGKLTTFRTNSQTYKILEYLQTGKSLTVLEASLMGLGMNLRSRISNIKEAGYNVKSERVKINGGYIARYSLILEEVA